jgi:lipoprotein-releasing system ATP-binding protein
MSDAILAAEHIHKSFLLPNKTRLAILIDLSLQVKAGVLVGICGASGSGKSTLLHLLGTLDAPDQGTILIHGQDTSGLPVAGIAALRNRTVGFVFQFHYLMPELTVLENVASPALVVRFNRQDALARAAHRLEQVGLADKGDCMPYQLSGGEKQRAAIARSLVNDPAILLADEPTGSLDWNTGERVFAVLQDLIKTMGLTAVVATHNPQLAALCDETYELRGGALIAGNPLSRGEH